MSDTLPLGSRDIAADIARQCQYIGSEFKIDVLGACPIC